LTFTLAKQNFAGITNNTQKRFLSGVLADFNGDLKMDLLLGNQAGDLQLYSNIAKGLSENIAPQTVLFSADKTLEPARFLGRGLQPTIFQHQLLVGSTGGGFFWLKMDNVVLGEDENESFSFKIYPNPSQNQVFIETQEALSMLIFAVDGKKIGETHALFVGKNDIGLNLSAGLYLFKFTKKSGEFFVRKMVVE
jgi:hypothetical protein